MHRARWSARARCRRVPDPSGGGGKRIKEQEEVAEPADKPGSVVDSHSSRRNVTAALKQPTRRHRGPRHCLPIWSCSRWGLPCRSVAGLAVRSYRTISPLPASCPSFDEAWSVTGLASDPRPGPLAVSFCCTFRRLAPPRRYLAPCPVEPGLSSACLRMTRLSGRLRRAHSLTAGAPAVEPQRIAWKAMLRIILPASARTRPCAARR